VKDGLPEKTNPSIRRGWKATDLLGDGKPPIKNFGVVFCEKRPHFFLPEIHEGPIWQSMLDCNW
jgi:hypothetical protein